MLRFAWFDIEFSFDICFVFFKQKTAYEMRISDWSSDVCSSDLGILKPSRLVAVGAQVSGRLVSLEVALGDKVAQGGLVAEIDSVNQQNELRTAEAALANVRAQRSERRATLKQAELELARQKKMVAQNAVSQAD